jgi:cell division protein FtsI (penicillin-binding protein 3)
VKIGNTLVEEEHGSLGRINIATILAKSSNVGITMLALSLEPKQMWTTLSNLGFGQVTTSGFPGESAGLLTSYSHWRPVAISRMSYGYGLSVTPLQLAHAYATVGAKGVMHPISFLMADKPPAGRQVIDPTVAGELVHLLEAVVTQDGTGFRAAIPGYRVSGKTGTAEKAIAGGYSKEDYMAVFAGVAPATNPRLAAVVVLNEPEGKHQGGEVAAPVFSEVVGGALRLMAVPPDQVVRDMDDAAKPMPGPKPLRTVKR